MPVTMKSISLLAFGLSFLQGVCAEPRRPNRWNPNQNYYVYRPGQQASPPAASPTSSSPSPANPIVVDTGAPFVENGETGGTFVQPVEHYYRPNPNPGATTDPQCPAGAAFCGGQPPPSGASIFNEGTKLPIPSNPVESGQNPPLPSQSGTVTGSNSCSGGSGGFQVSWSGDVVQLGNNMKTQGCTDLSSISSGRIYVGGNGAQGTLLEWTPNTGSPYYDVSFVEGFTVPLVCRGGSGSGSSGCPIDISGGTYLMNPSYIGGQHATGSYAGSAGASPWCWTCTAQGAPWDQCSGSAYTYPYDDKAMGGVANSVECCVGTSCAGTGREGSGVPGNNQPDRQGGPCTICGGGSKRGLDDMMGPANETETESSSAEQDLRMHRRGMHARRHGRPGGDNPWSPVNPNAQPGKA